MSQTGNNASGASYEGGLPLFNMTLDELSKVTDPVPLMSAEQWWEFANSFVPVLGCDWRDGYIDDPLQITHVLKMASVGCEQIARWALIGQLQDALEEKGRQKKNIGCHIIPRWLKHAAAELEEAIHQMNPTLPRSWNAKDSTVKRVIAVLKILKLDRDLGQNRLKARTVYEFLKEPRG